MRVVDCFVDQPVLIIIIIIIIIIINNNTVILIHGRLADVSPTSISTRLARARQGTMTRIRLMQLNWASNIF